MNKRCTRCGKIYRRFGIRRRAHSRFCSFSCYCSWRKETRAPSGICIVCSGSFYAPPSLAAQRFCSSKCRYKAAATTRIARFWSYVKKSEDGCWIWMRAVTKFGYGSFTAPYLKRGVEHAHRVAWRLTYGDIPAGKQILHHCDNPACVRPDHLFIGTPRDNVLDAMNKGRMRNQCGPIIGPSLRRFGIRSRNL